MEYAIETSDLTKIYGNFKAVNNLDIHVPVGKVYGFLGRNGSGKTTTIRMIMGLIHPNKGNIKVMGIDMFKERENTIKMVGAIVETPGFYENLSAHENLEITVKMFKVEKRRINEVLEIVGLSNIGNKKVGNFSLGMKQRLGIANALIHSPKILILDEPTNGLDPAGIKEMRKLIKYLSKSLDITIFISSHLLSEIQQIADYIGIIDKGKMIEEGEIKDIHTIKQNYLLLEVDDMDKTIDIIKSMDLSFKLGKNSIKIFCKRNENSRINKILVENKINVYNLESVSKTLEERFLGITTDNI
jgi:ABC-type multidrug transport system ATPase subunit